MITIMTIEEAIRQYIVPELHRRERDGTVRVRLLRIAVKKLRRYAKIISLCRKIPGPVTSSVLASARLHVKDWIAIVPDIDINWLVII